MSIVFNKEDKIVLEINDKCFIKLMILIADYYNLRLYLIYIRLLYLILYLKEYKLFMIYVTCVSKYQVKFTKFT